MTIELVQKPTAEHPNKTVYRCLVCGELFVQGAISEYQNGPVKAHCPERSDDHN